MTPLRESLSTLFGDAFERVGIERHFGEVVVSARPDLGQFQCNGALAAARAHGRKPREVAEAVVGALARRDLFREVTIAGPGFVNLTLTDECLAEHLRAAAAEGRLGCPRAGAPARIVIDYGGPNIAKPMHVGHLRAAIIGESLKRLARFLGRGGGRCPPRGLGAPDGDGHLGARAPPARPPLLRPGLLRLLPG